MTAKRGDDARQERDPAAVRRFVERYATILVETGFPRMPARVFVALLATDSGRLTAVELAEMLHISPAAISNATRYLVGLNLATREREVGSRRDVYRVLPDVWHDSLVRQDELLRRWESGLQEGISVLGRDTPAGQRLIESLAFVEFMEQKTPELLREWRERQAELRASWSDALG